jgi:hypothetical protein
LQQVDLRLVPELEPVLAERLIETDLARSGGGTVEPVFAHDLPDGGPVDRLRQGRQHPQGAAPPELSELLDDGGFGAAVHELHRPAIRSLSQRLYRFNGLRRPLRDVEEDQVGHAAGKAIAQAVRLGEQRRFDAVALQGQR